MGPEINAKMISWKISIFLALAVGMVLAVSLRLEEGVGAGELPIISAPARPMRVPPIVDAEDPTPPNQNDSTAERMPAPMQVRHVKGKIIPKPLPVEKVPSEINGQELKTLEK